MNDQLFEDDSDQLDPNKILSTMADPSVLARWEGTLGAMVKIAEAELCKSLDDEQQAIDLAQRIILAVCEHLGGSVMYLPRGTRLKNAMRDVAIFRDWHDNGIIPANLVGKYGLSSQTIYAIINRQRELRRRSEPDLFGFDEGTVH